MGLSSKSTQINLLEFTKSHTLQFEPKVMVTKRPNNGKTPNHLFRNIIRGASLDKTRGLVHQCELNERGEELAMKIYY